MSRPPFPLRPAPHPDPHQLPALQPGTPGPARLACGPWKPRPHWPAASPPPPHAHLQHGSRATAFTPESPSWRLPSQVGGPALWGVLSISHFAAGRLCKTCPAELLLGEAAAGGTQAGRVAWWWGARTWVHTPALSFQVMRPWASHSASQSPWFPSAKLGKQWHLLPFLPSRQPWPRASDCKN